MMFQEAVFKDKKVLVTGGGTGIGYAISKMFLEQGAMVYISSRKEEKLKEAVSSLSEFGKCEYVIADIRNIDNVEEVASKLEGLDILINNAGGQFYSPAEMISINGWNSVINNNLNGTWYMTQVMSKKFFIPQKHGVIVNIIANMFRGFPGMVHTGAARAGVDNITKTLAVEWARHQIRVNSVAPGVIASSGLDNYPEAVKELTLKEVPKRIPMKKLGTPEDVAWLTLFLASPFASYITGETVYVDGGQRLWGDTFVL